MPLIEAIDKATSPHQPPHPVPSFPQQMLPFHSKSLPPLQLQTYILTSVLYPNWSLRSCILTLLYIYLNLSLILILAARAWLQYNRSPDPKAPGMPPRNSLTSSFSASDANNEVVCPLRNQDGSNCRKRCLGVSTDNRKQRADFIRLGLGRC